MPIPATCPSCGKTYQVADRQAGMRVRCTQCGGTFQVPLPAQPPIPTAGKTPEAAAPASPAGKPARTSGIAIASFIIGIAGVVLCFLSPLAAIPAIILGVLALRRIRRSDGALGGRGFAIAGLCSGALSVLMIGMLLLMLMPALEKARRSTCKRNLNQMGLGIEMYLGIYDGYYPHDPRGPSYSLAALYPQYVSDERVFVCPSGKSSETFPSGTSLAGKPCFYQYNLQLTTTRRTTFETWVVREPFDNHRDGANVLYSDYSVRWERKEADERR